MNRLSTVLVLVSAAFSSRIGTQAAMAQGELPLTLRQARAAMEAGRIEDAIHLAQQYTGDHPREARGYVVLGDAYFSRMPAGRFLAARAYLEAERLAPRDPEPPYKYAQAGLWLGGDDGEAMAKQGLERVLELDPSYGDAWDQWLTLFRNSGSRRRMRERLGPHASDPVIRSRLALLAVEDERYDEADAMLDTALAADSTNVSWLALRAQSAFESGDTLEGWTYYRRALAHADRDSTEALWRQVIGIARPSEIQAWTAGVPPGQRGAWLEGFWARRNPNLFSGVNHRVGEHFARLRFARKRYPLLHPLISYHRSQISRAMNLEPSTGERAFYQRCEMYEVLMPPHLPFWIDTAGKGREGVAAIVEQLQPLGVSRASDRARVNPEPAAILAGTEFEGSLPNWLTHSFFAPLNLNLKSMDSIAARIGYNLATGLDDRGVMFLRFGPPNAESVGGTNDVDVQCGVPDVERWRYDEYGEVRFARPSAFSRGERTVPDMVFRAMNERQFEAVQIGLTRDASSESAPLEFGVWTAQFADPSNPDATDVVVVATRGRLAASLVGRAGAGAAQTDPGGIVTLSEFPGHYLLLAHAEDSSRLGRLALGISLKRFQPLPAVSDLLLAPAWEDRTPGRAAMLARVERTLVFAQGLPIRAYAEVYGLKVNEGVAQYLVQYALLKTDSPERDIRRNDWPGAVRLEFRRVQAASAGSPVQETLDLVPERIPEGNYLLRLRVEDLTTQVGAGSATISFVVR